MYYLLTRCAVCSISTGSASMLSFGVVVQTMAESKDHIAYPVKSVVA